MKLLRRTWHVVSILILIAVGCASLQNSDRRETGNETNASGQVEAPRPTAPATSAERQPDADNNQQTSQNLRSRFLERFIDPVTWFTFGLLLVSIRQFRAMRRQAEHMRDALAITRVIERAWVTVDRLEVEHSTKLNGHDHTLAVSLKNSGRSTARIIAANITLRSCYDDNGTIREFEDLPDTPVYDDTPVVVPPAVLVTNETSTMRVGLDAFKQLDAWHLTVTSKSDAAWIYGYVEYTDGVEPHRIRRYGWARKFDRPLSERNPTGYRVRFRHVHNRAYNYAD